MRSARQRLGTAMAQALVLALAATAALSSPAAAADPEIRARWDFRTGSAEDLSGTGHDGEVGGGVTFTPDGAVFDGSDDGEIRVPYAPDYQPEAIAPGQRWSLELTDVVPTAVGGVHRAIVSGRAANDGWVVYLNPQGVLQFWTGQAGGSAAYVQASSGVVADVGSSYDITVGWDGAEISITVAGDESGSGRSAPAGGYRPMAPDQPLRFGNGGNTGSEFFFAGSIGGATIGVDEIPPPPPADEVCQPTGATVVPVDWDAFDAGLPGDERTTLLRDVSLNATRYTTTTWFPEQYGEQDWRPYLDFGGTGELAIRGPAMAAVGAAVPLATGAYDAEAVGLSAQEATDVVTRLVTSLAYQHRANTPGGWGDVATSWQTPLWAFYTGMAGWLLWEELPAADRVCVQRMVEYEAERVPAPRYYRDADGDIVSGGNTQAEEDSAWASLLGLATAMLPGHDDWLDWQRRNVELLAAAYARPADVDSDEVLNGRALADLLDGSNIEDDGTVVNHGFLHPIYMLAFDQSVNVGLTSSLAGQATPEAALHNVDVVYDALVDLDFPAPPFRAPGGTIYRDGSADIYYPEGNDWGTAFPLYFAQADVLADVFGQDHLASTAAAEWERLHLAEALAMQQRHPDGHTYADTTESNYVLREERITQIAGLSYLARWLDHQDAVCVTARPYTTAVADPVLGELEAPAAAADALRETAAALRAAGERGTATVAARLEATAGRLDRHLDAIADARRDGDDARLRRAVERALGAATRLDDQVADAAERGQVGNADAAAVAADLDAAITGLSTVHRCAFSSVSARVALSDNAVGAGETVTATVVVANDGDEPLRGLQVTVDAPAGWTVTPTDASLNALAAGEQAAVAVRITAPATQEATWGDRVEVRVSARVPGGGRVVATADAAIAGDGPVGG